MGVVFGDKLPNHACFIAGDNDYLIAIGIAYHCIDNAFQQTAIAYS